MNTLADLKRKLIKGQGVKLIRFKTPFDINNKNLNKVRYVVKIQSNGIYLNEDKNAENGSYLEFPKASLLDVGEQGFRIFEEGKRDLTEEEKKILDNEPSNRPENREIAEADAISDGSRTYWMDKRYYKEHNAEWRWNKSRGLRLDHNDKRMWDDNIRGELSLEYEFAEN